MSKGYYTFLELFDEKNAQVEIRKEIQSGLNPEIPSELNENDHQICFKSMNPPIEFLIKLSGKYPDTLVHLRSIHAAVTDHVKEYFLLNGEIVKEYQVYMNE